MSPRLRGFETEFERHIVFSWATTDWIWFLTQFYPIAMAPHLALPGEDVISRTIESLRRVAAQVTEDEAPWKDHRMPDVTRLVFSGDQLIGEPQ